MNQFWCNALQFSNQRCEEFLFSQKNAGLLRNFDRTQFLKNDFSSNDYLGLCHSEIVKAGGIQFAEKYGAGSGASRLVKCDFENEIANLENSFSNFVKQDTSLLLPSAFVASCAFFESIQKIYSPKECEIFLDHRAHASLHTAVFLSGFAVRYFPHRNYSSLQKKLLQSKAAVKLIVVESLHSMDGDIENSSELLNVCQSSGAVIYLDDSHGIGILGPKGSGWLNNEPKLKPYVLASVFGCGKALGVSGGFLCTSSALKECVVQASRFLKYSTGIAPFIVGALSQSVRLLQSDFGEQERRQLQSNLLHMQQLFANVNSFNKDRYSLVFSQIENSFGTLISPIVYLPVKNFEEIDLLKLKLLRSQILAKPMRSPTVPKGTERFRFIVRSSHINTSFEILKECLSL